MPDLITNPSRESAFRPLAPDAARSYGPGTLKLFRLMLWVHWRTLLANIRGVRHQSPLLLAVLGGFFVGYLGLGYWLFHAGLNYLYQFPLIGSLLAQRLVFLIFSCFFLLLIFSNLIIGYSLFFKNRETEWMLSLPIRHRDVFRWKCLECLVVSSWALIFLSAPMLLAYGQVRHVAPLFYGEILGAYAPFVVLPALIGSWIILALVHVISHAWTKRAMIILAGCALVWLAVEIKPVEEAQVVSSVEALSFEKLLRHTAFSQHLLLPSSWLAQTVLACSDELTRKGSFFFCVLLSNALMGVLISFGVADRYFHASWCKAISSRAARFHLKAERKRSSQSSSSLLEWSIDRIPLLSQPIRALALKDARLFWRDPAQWTQFLILFGLLSIYVINLRNVSFNFRNLYWETIISYLNLAASALTLATLTTRFVFPQFSLEGRRLWIIGLAPIGLRKVILQKFWSSFLICSALTAPLMLVSSVVLHLPWTRVLFFVFSIIVLSASLSGLAAGLGALYPNFKEDNPSKVVSGFGGTLCLVVSFLYITSFVALTAIPPLKELLHWPIPVPAEAALIAAFGFSGCILFVPLILALRRLKSLEF